MTNWISVYDPFFEMCAMWSFAEFCGNLNPMLHWSDSFWPFRRFRSKNFQFSRIVGERLQLISWKSMSVSQTFQENLLNLCLCLITTSITRPILFMISDQCLVSFLFKRWGVKLRKKQSFYIFIWFSQAFFWVAGASNVVRHPLPTRVSVSYM